MLILVIANFVAFKLLADGQRAREFFQLGERLSVTERALNDLASRQETDIREVCEYASELLRRQLGMIERLNAAHSVLSERVEFLSRDSQAVFVCVYDVY